MEQVVGVLKQAEPGVPAVEVIRKAGISGQTFYRWKAKYGGLDVDQARRPQLAVARGYDIAISRRLLGINAREDFSLGQ